jgi:hypothetical protein
MPISGENQTNWFHKDYQYLKVKPEGMKNLRKNYSQVWQDIFALVVNDAKVDGIFLEIGGAQPVQIYLATPVSNFSSSFSYPQVLPLDTDSLYETNWFDSHH